MIAAIRVAQCSRRGSDTSRLVSRRTEEYATKIARDWNTKDAVSGNVGYVLRFSVRADALERWPPQQGAAGVTFRELWVPAEELDDFNAAIVGRR